MNASRVLSQAEIERRMLLWQALGDLYLDTECETFVPNILGVAREGGFSLAEVDLILRWEVRPALYSNILSVAGEWAGWDADWLRDQILQTIANPPLFCRWPLRWLMQNRFMPEPEWGTIRDALGEETFGEPTKDG